jgi:hypothetical protein
MLRKILAAASLATVAAAFSLGTGTAANSTPISGPMTVAGAPSSAIEAAYVVKKKVIIKKRHGHVVSKRVVVTKYHTNHKRRNVWVYNSHRYGARYHHRHGAYVYYYGGYYYPRPWWTIRIGL